MQYGLRIASAHLGDEASRISHNSLFAVTFERIAPYFYQSSSDCVRVQSILCFIIASGLKLRFDTLRF